MKIWEIMNQNLQVLKNSNVYFKIINWIRLALFTGGAQAIIQLLGLISGLCVIRYLPTNEYALYTLTNSILSVLTILADGGISTAVMAEGGKAWEDKEKLGLIVSTGINLRKRLAIISFFLIMPFLLYTLLKNGADNITAFLLIISLLPTFWGTISGSILEVVPRLHQNIRPLQKNQMNIGIARFVLTSLSLMLFPYSYIAICMSGIPRLIGNIQLKKIVNTVIQIDARIDSETYHKILKVIKRMLPGLIYYCLAGQLNIWLISIFGNAKSIATAGALSRISMTLGLVSSIFVILVVPRFARLLDKRDIIRGAFIKVQTLLLAIVMVVMIFFWVFRQPTLWLLGNKYSNYEEELILNLFGSCVVLLVGSTYTIYSSRGWIMHPIHSISVSVAAIVLGIQIFDLSTLKGVLYLNIFVALLEYINHLLYSIIKINKIRTI